MDNRLTPEYQKKFIEFVAKQAAKDEVIDTTTRALFMMIKDRALYEVELVRFVNNSNSYNVDAILGKILTEFYNTNKKLVTLSERAPGAFWMDKHGIDWYLLCQLVVDYINDTEHKCSEEDTRVSSILTTETFICIILVMILAIFVAAVHLHV